METLSIHQAGEVAGGNFLFNFAFGKFADYCLQQILAGNVDYAGVAEAQGTYYNTVGA